MPLVVQGICAQLTITSLANSNRL